MTSSLCALWCTCVIDSKSVFTLSQVDVGKFFIRLEKLNGSSAISKVDDPKDDSRRCLEIASLLHKNFSHVQKILHHYALTELRANPWASTILEGIANTTASLNNVLHFPIFADVCNFASCLGHPLIIVLKMCR